MQHHGFCLLLVSAVLSLATARPAAAQNTPPATLVDVRKIWDAAPHNAFTDLIRFQNQWFCVFREGTGHVNYHGKLRVIASADGEQWESTALLSAIFADLRDAKITVTPKQELMLSGAAAMHPPIPFRHQSLSWFSPDGRAWSEASKIGDTNMWLWRATWHKGTAYCIGYRTVDPKFTRLYTSKDGRTFDTRVDRLFDRGYPNEHGLVFLSDDTAVCLLRRDGAENTAQLGTAKPPYQAWEWRDLGLYVGGPALIRLPDGRLLAGGRKLVRAKPPEKKATGPKTVLWSVDLIGGKLTELLEFPSGGDTSYPGLVWHDDLLWVSYYSSHEGKTSIYLARVRLPAGN